MVFTNGHLITNGAKDTKGGGRLAGNPRQNSSDPPLPFTPLRVARLFLRLAEARRLEALNASVYAARKNPPPAFIWFYGNYKEHKRRIAKAYAGQVEPGTAHRLRSARLSIQHHACLTSLRAARLVIRLAGGSKAWRARNLEGLNAQSLRPKQKIPPCLAMVLWYL